MQVFDSHGPPNINSGVEDGVELFEGHPALFASEEGIHLLVECLTRVLIVGLVEDCFLDESNQPQVIFAASDLLVFLVILHLVIQPLGALA